MSANQMRAKNADKDMEKGELLHTAGGNVN